MAGLGGLAGYWTRIVQKFEDRRDQISLTELPAIYADMCAIGDALELFKSGTPLESLTNSLDELSKSLKKGISSGNILVFREQFYQPLYQFYQDLHVLQAVSAGILKNDEKAVLEERLRSVFSKDEAFPLGRFSPKPKEILENNSKMIKVLRKELKGYRSYSWKITLAIFAIGAFVALVEIIKSYFSA